VNVNPPNDLILAAGDELLVVAPSDRLVDLEATNRVRSENGPAHGPPEPVASARGNEVDGQPTRG
jgi:hypothetical protein